MASSCAWQRPALLGFAGGHGGSSAFYYLIAVPLLLLPWGGLSFKRPGRVRSDVNDPSRRFLWMFWLCAGALAHRPAPSCPTTCSRLHTLVHPGSGCVRAEARRAWPHLIAPGLLLCSLPLLPNLFDALARSLDAG